MARNQLAEHLQSLQIAKVEEGRGRNTKLKKSKNLFFFNYPSISIVLQPRVIMIEYF
jgi:hypothetical protein